MANIVHKDLKSDQGLSAVRYHQRRAVIAMTGKKN